MKTIYDLEGKISTSSIKRCTNKGQVHNDVPQLREVPRTTTTQRFLLDRTLSCSLR